MRTCPIPYTPLILVIAFMLFTLCVPAAAAPGASWNVTRLSPETDDCVIPQISGDYAIWAAYFGGLETKNDTPTGIVLHTIATGETRTLASSENGTNPWGPDICGDSVVWVDETEGDMKIHHYAVSIGVDTVLAESEDSLGWPSVSGDAVVWTENVGGNRTDIRLHALLTGATTTPVSIGAQHVLADIDGDRICYLNLDEGILSVYNITSGENVRISGEAANPLEFAISGDRILWLDEYDDWSKTGFIMNNTLYLFSLDTGMSEVLDRSFNSVSSSNGSTDVNTYTIGYPAISGDTAAWIRKSTVAGNDTAVVQVCDLADGTQSSLVRGRQTSRLAADDGRLIWEEDTGDLLQTAIMLAETGPSHASGTPAAPPAAETPGFGILISGAALLFACVLMKMHR
jgi:hypothetical protein